MSTRDGDVPVASGSRSHYPSINLPSSATSITMDAEERWLASPVSTARSYVSLRKRRAFATVGAVVTLMMLGGWWTVGVPDMLDPGGLISEHDFGGSSTDPSTVPHKHADNGIPVLPSVNIETWGLKHDSDNLLSGQIPWPSIKRYSELDKPSSSLGHKADEVYNLGYWELPETAAQLDVFVGSCFPEKLQGPLKFGIARYLAGVAHRDGWNMTHANEDGEGEQKRTIWQTAKDKSKDGTPDVQSWRYGRAQDEGWDWKLIPDGEADAWVEKHFAGSKIHYLWTMLPSGILRSDMLRYLLLLVDGGIYTDTDTRLRKPPSFWGRGAKLWANGKGLTKDEQNRIAVGEPWEDVLGPPSVVVGVEADVGERDDWNDWWPRPIQIVQWTIGSAPSHPILLSSILRILHSTAKAVDWAHTHQTKIESLRERGKEAQAKELEQITVLDEPKEGGPVGVMDWTGPGLFTDAVLGYLNVRFGMVWTDLKDIREPLRVGDVVILPVTGFSPGVGNFGAQAPSHPQAMVEHKFKGSWRKTKKKD